MTPSVIVLRRAPMGWAAACRPEKTTCHSEGRADWNRALVLRTGSNYDMQPPGMTAAESANHERSGSYTGYLPALETAYLIGSRVVKTLLSDWPRYEQSIPAASP